MTREKTGRSGAASAVIGIAIVAAVALWMVTGNVAVDCGETSLKIHASYWKDREIPYSEINTAAYRQDLDVGTRTSGVGTLRLSLGNFCNEEFGAYTLYAYTGAKDFVVLTLEDETIAIGMRSAEETKAAYDALLAHGAFAYERQQEERI